MAKQFLADFENSRFINVSGNYIEPVINIYRGSTYEFNTILLENYNTYSPINLSGNTDFGCYIGRLYGVSASPVVSSNSFNTDISALSAGVLNFTFDASVSTLAVDMGSTFSTDYQIEIWSKSGPYDVLILQSPITLLNIAVEPPQI